MRTTYNGNIYFSTDGSWGDATDLVVIDTADWTDADHRAFDGFYKSERFSYINAYQDSCITPAKFLTVHGETRDNGTTACRDSFWDGATNTDVAAHVRRLIDEALRSEIIRYYVAFDNTRTRNDWEDTVDRIEAQGAIEVLETLRSAIDEEVGL